MSDKQDLDFTGERLIPGIKGLEGLEIEHKNRYLFSQQFAKKDFRALDIGCGEGYGSNLMLEKVKSVVGIDIDKKTIDHARGKYPKVDFRELDVRKIQSLEQTFDIATCFELIEHIDEKSQIELVKNLKEVLSEDGILIISTPNKENYRKDEHPNEFHQKELSESEFKTLLENNFKYVELMYQSNQFSNNIYIPSNKENSVSIDYPNQCNFFVAVCSDKKINITPNYINIYPKEADYYSSEIIHSLKQQLSDQKEEIVRHDESWEKEMNKRDKLWRKELEKREGIWVSEMKKLGKGSIISRLEQSFKSTLRRTIKK